MPRAMGYHHALHPRCAVPEEYAMSQYQSSRHNNSAKQLGRLIVSQNPYGEAQEIGERASSQVPHSYGDAAPMSPGAFNTLNSEEAKNAAGAESGISELELDGLAAGHYNAHGKRLTYDDVLKLRAVPQEGVWWYFGGKPRYVAKALRIPYVYTIETPDGTKKVSDWLLVGFEGAGW
jgi:hypothetical protein